MDRYSQAIKVIVNPPYDGNLHLKVVQEAMKHSDDVVNLSPVRWLQDPLAEEKKNSDWWRFKGIRVRIHDLDTIPRDEANRYFGTDLISDLGIYEIKSTVGDKFITKENSPLVEKVLAKAKTLVPLKSKLEKTPQGLSLKFSDCISTDQHTSKKYFITSAHYETATSITGKCHTLYLNNIKSEETRRNIYATYTSDFMRWFNKAICGGACNYNFTPYFVDYTRPWDDAALYKYFGLTQEEISLIEEEMKGA